MIMIVWDANTLFVFDSVHRHCRTLIFILDQRLASPAIYNDSCEWNVKYSMFVFCLCIEIKKEPSTVPLET